MYLEGPGQARRPEVRYAQCWEDADVLLTALDIGPEHTCLSIASGGDNTLALLSRGPRRVIAVDSNPAQIACLELRMAAYRELTHPQMLQLLGALPGNSRQKLYRRCRPLLSAQSRRFWDGSLNYIDQGILSAGRLERYLSIFRTHVLPLVHQPNRVDQLLQILDSEERREFYNREWNSPRWRFIFRLFFSRWIMARLGREAACFRFARTDVAQHLLDRSRYALTELQPWDNPYLQWILTGQYCTALPYSLRPENYDAIRHRLDRVEWHCGSIETLLDSFADEKIDRYNLSDIFEYLPLDAYHCLLERLAVKGKAGARLAYWNMLVKRRRPPQLADRLRPLTSLSRRLYAEDKAFFYSDFVLEEVIGC